MDYSLLLQLLTSLDVGAKFDSQLKEFTYDVQGKKTLPVTDNGLLSVDIKGGYNYNPGSRKVGNPVFESIGSRLALIGASLW